MKEEAEEIKKDASKQLQKTVENAKKN